MTTTDKHFSPGRWALLAIVFVLVLGVLAWATMEQRKSIYKTANELGGCKTFVECIQKAGLSGILEKDGPFSVFIPTDEAFSKVSPEELTKLLNNKSALTALLLYHMVPKTMTQTEMGNFKDCMTCTVPQTSIACSETSYGKGKCVQAAVPCTNGVIYLIDSVQFPPFLGNENNQKAASGDKSGNTADSSTGQKSQSGTNGNGGQGQTASESLTIIESIQTEGGNGSGQTAATSTKDSGADKSGKAIPNSGAKAEKDAVKTPVKESASSGNSSAAASEKSEPAKQEPKK